ncbi:MAG: transcriptional regulator [Caldisphaera sp.]|jgi:DNA-binding MarR family transcriptional regulator|nr:transcriptional regulator [Caldisphaera sp.]PMP90651.1 MAG: transcriptional regulator [Caldisphaera sp.]
MVTLVKSIIEVFADSGPMSPGDVAQKLSMPRYKILATIQCLYEFGFLDALYSRGSYKIYQLSVLGRKFLEKAKSEESIKELLEESILNNGVQENKSHALT